VIVWLTAWDSDTDAVDFAGAFAVIHPEAAVQRRGTRVLVLLGPAPPDLADRIWRQPRGHPKRAQSAPPSRRLSSALCCPRGTDAASLRQSCLVSSSGRRQRARRASLDITS